MGNQTMDDDILEWHMPDLSFSFRIEFKEEISKYYVYFTKRKKSRVSGSYKGANIE